MWRAGIVLSLTGVYVHDNLQVNLGDDYRGHLVAAHGVKHNFNYYMQQVRIRI